MARRGAAATVSRLQSLPAMARVCVLLLTVLACATGYASQDVIISPNSNQTVIRSGDVLSLECSSNKHAYWVPPVAVEPSRMNVSYWQDGRNYKTKLEIQPAAYSYTGYYECIQNISHTDILGNSSTRIYVYVKDGEHLFLTNMAIEIMSVKQRNNVTLPCIVTSPEVNVTLRKNDVEVVTGSLRPGGLEAHYDPTKGFTLLHMDVSNSGFYDCIATLGDKEQQITFIVDVMPTRL